MTNSILETLRNGTQRTNLSNIAPILSLFGMVKNAKNPYQMLNVMLGQNNPMMQHVIQLINQNGGDAQKAFYNFAQQVGANPDEILSMLY